MTRETTQKYKLRIHHQKLSSIDVSSRALDPIHQDPIHQDPIHCSKVAVTTSIVVEGPYILHRVLALLVLTKHFHLMKNHSKNQN